MKKIFVCLFLTFFYPKIFKIIQAQELSSPSFFKRNLSMPLDVNFEFLKESRDIDYGRFRDKQRFYYTNFQFDIKGALNQNIGFNFETLLNSTTLNESDILESITNANIVVRSNNHKWSFCLGRYIVKFGSCEQYYSGSDVAVYSLVGGAIGVFKTGASIAYTPNDHQDIGFQIVNADNDNTVLYMEYNLYWRGDIFPDLLRTYMSVSTVQKGQLDRFPYALNIGLQWHIDDFVLDTDYRQLKNMTNFYKGVRYASIPIKLQYETNHFCPYVKYIYNRVDFNGLNFNVENSLSSLDALDDLSSHTYLLGLQFYPKQDGCLSFYLIGAYTSEEDILSSIPNLASSNSRGVHYGKYQIQAGLKLKLDFLKSRT
ncbi:hypothetical protein K4L44_14325 [Halosquirtibacter laminarini]|uniref:Uncharacterized protein n=1 Tax=Halosquirtibacter laminarini TaxID=3374600 RepID=A0AC61NJZ4_9BACT|nr:hypothetical protein K4L44_14325 [Prolixibacteraceae bacterium]